MTFEEAIAQIDDNFPRMGGDERTPSRQILVCSGGVIDKPDDNVPALLISRDLAIDLWCDSMLIELGNIENLSGYTFLDGPHCDQHTMTNQTVRNQQRLVDPRFSVTATVGLFLTS